ERSGDLAADLRRLASDSFRLVRMEAARVLLHASPDAVPVSPEDSVVWRALTEYQGGQRALSEQPAAHLNLAVVHERLRELDDAREAWRIAGELDACVGPARLIRATLLGRSGIEALESGDQSTANSLFEVAEGALRPVIRLERALSEAQYALGLLLAESDER